MLHLNFNPFPTLTTERLILRKMKLEDERDVLRLRSDKRINAFVERPEGQTIEDARAFIRKINTSIDNNESITWMISMKDDQRTAGNFTFWNINREADRAEAGYALMTEYEGKGIMQEAFSKLLEYGFDIMGLKAVEAYTHRDNVKSVKLLEKNSFKRDLAKEAEKCGTEEPLTTMIYTLNPDI